MEEHLILCVMYSVLEDHSVRVRIMQHEEKMPVWNTLFLSVEINYRLDFAYIVKLCFCSVKLKGCLATNISLQNKTEHYCAVSNMILIQKQTGSLKKHGVVWESVTTSWPSFQPYSGKFNFTSSNFINLEFIRSAHIWCIKAKQMLPQCVSVCMGLFVELIQ